MAQLLYLIKSARIAQWIKNFALFAPIIFSGFLFAEQAFSRVLGAFIIFSLLTSSVYIFNDVMDIAKDRNHPFKKNRPIASGKLPVYVAIFWFITLATVSLFLGAQLSSFFFMTLLAYFILNIGYSLWWKRVAILDVMSIAAGFVLRVYAGAFVIDVHMDVWFLLTVVSASLFLAVGKRRSEMTLLAGVVKSKKTHRSTLMNYTPDLLDSYTGMFANTTWLTYTFFTFLYPGFQPEGRVLRLFLILPRTLITEKWLMITVPVVIYGVMRYLQLIYEQNKGESPHKVLLTDAPLLIAVSLWVVMVVGILYFL